MAQKREITNLEQMLERIRRAGEHNASVSLNTVREELGTRTFGPLLLLAGLIVAAPVVGDIPGVPTLMGIFVFLISIQLLIGRDHIWLPHWLADRSVASERVQRAVSWSQRPARFIDRFLRPRLTFLVQETGRYGVAVFCLLIAVALPPMEIVPFTANGAGVALLAFGLALIAQDGLLALIAFIVTALSLGAVLYGVL